MSLFVERIAAHDQAAAIVLLSIEKLSRYFAVPDSVFMENLYTLMISASTLAVNGICPDILEGYPFPDAIVERAKAMLKKKFRPGSRNRSLYLNRHLCYDLDAYCLLAVVSQGLKTDFSIEPF